MESRSNDDVSLGAPIACRLCGEHRAIRSSHVVPAFVFRAIKKDSPTGFLRNAYEPNRRLQDGDKLPLLCDECEQRFGDSERVVATDIFDHFHTQDINRFQYGPALHYFMASIAWRTLILDLPDLRVDKGNPSKAIDAMDTASEVLRQYLLGAAGQAAMIKEHCFLAVAAHRTDDRLAKVGPNVLVRRSAFGYSVVHRLFGYSGVIHNLAGFMCFLIIKGNPRDQWSGTRVDPAGGLIVPPQRVNSWLAGNLLEKFADMGENYPASAGQRKIIADSVAKNPNAPAMRFRDVDRRLS